MEDYHKSHESLKGEEEILILYCHIFQRTGVLHVEEDG